HRPLRDCAGRDAARQAGGHDRAAEGGAGAAARDQPDGCAARQHRGRDQEETGGRQQACPRQRREEEGRTLSKPAEPDRSSRAGPVAFTGRLAAMTRAAAFALVAQHGGTPRRGVTRQTNVLIVGELGWPLLADGRPSNSLAQAKQYGVPIVSERTFLGWVGN